MPFRRRAKVLAGLALFAIPGPAAAEGFLESIFGSSKSVPAPAARSPATEPAPRAKHSAPESKPRAEPRSTGTTAPVVASATPSASLPAPSGASAPLTERAALERASAYFNGIGTLVGDFTQMGADGRKLAGKLYLQRPGRLRFEYEAPATLEVIADGSSVAVKDRKLLTQDLYLIGQTPLKFLLSSRVDLSRDLTPTGVTSDPEGVRIALEDRSTIGGTSKITLYFDPEVKALGQWRIVDPQGYQTTVVLSNLEKGRRIDQSLFVINYERNLDTGRRND